MLSRKGAPGGHPIHAKAADHVEKLAHHGFPVIGPWMGAPRLMRVLRWSGSRLGVMAMVMAKAAAPSPLREPKPPWPMMMNMVVDIGLFWIRVFVMVVVVLGE